MLRSVVSLCVVSALALAGCKDECSAADFPVHCEANVLVSCPTPGVDQLVPVRISRTDCSASVCVPLDGGALCALSGAPSPLCAGDVRSACDGTTAAVDCSRGFSTYRYPCRTCESGDAGRECLGGPSSRCSADSDCAAELSCQDAGYGSYCFKPR